MKVIYKLFGMLRRHPKLLNPKFTIPFFIGLLLLLLANYFFSGVIIALLWIMIVITGVSFITTIGKEEGSFYLLVACLFFLALLQLYSNYLSEINLVLLLLLILPLPMQLFSLLLYRYYKIIEVHYVEDVVEKYNHKWLKRAVEFYRKGGFYEALDDYYNHFYISKIGRLISNCWETIANVMRMKKRVRNSDIDSHTAEYYFSMYDEALEILENLTVKMAYNDEILERSDTFYDLVELQLNEIYSSLSDMQKEFENLIVSGGSVGMFVEKIEGFSIKLTETNKALRELNLNI